MSTRKNIMLGTAGHVDHGKTALVKMLTGCDTDRLPEEKQRGLTIEPGYASCRMADERIVGIVDVPGHVDFIRNMAAGAHGVDVVILVVAADDSVMPQTREHLDILTLMGIRRGIVAMTKIDLVDPVLREAAAEEISDFVRGTFLAGAPICPVSSITGEGFEGFLEALNAAVDSCEPRECGGLFRLWVERSFQIRGFGTVISGVPSRGEVRVGDRLRVVPGDRTGRVRRLEVYGQDAELGRAGECVAINITDLSPESVGRGCVVCEGEDFQVAGMVEAEVRLLESVSSPLKDNTEVHVHVGTADVMAQLALLEHKTLEPGGCELAQLRLARLLGVAPGERFVIRAGTTGLAGGRVTTVGGGRILATSNVRLRRNRPWVLESLAARRQALDSPQAWCEVVLKESAAPLNLAALAGGAGMRLDQVRGHAQALLAGGKVMTTGGDAFVHHDTVELAGKRTLELLAKFHQANPKRGGIEQEQLYAETGSHRSVFDLAVGVLVAEGRVQCNRSIIALAGRTADLSAEDRDLCGRVESALQAAGFAPPAVEELAAMTGQGRARISAMIRLLADRGRVVILDEKVVMHADGVDAARKAAIELFRRTARFSTMEFRDALAVSRKYAVPLLDYFDKIRLTSRSGSHRTPGAAAKPLL